MSVSRTEDDALFRDVEDDNATATATATATAVATAAVSATASTMASSSSLQVALREAKLLDPREDVLGYKVVHWCKTSRGGDVENIKALLHLQIPGKGATIYDSEGSSATVPVYPAQGNFVDNRKYCTDRLFVTAVQFFGASEAVLKALCNYQQSHGHLLSGYAGANRFEYDLDALHLEPRAGKPGCGCKHGMHFFRDIDAALRHYGRLDGLAPGEMPIVAKRLTQGRGLVTDIDGEALAKKHFGDAVECSANSAADRRQARLLSFCREIAKLAAESNNNNVGCATSATSASATSATSATGMSAATLKRPLSVGYECPICLEPSTDCNPVQSLGCHLRHAFHKICLFGHTTCPLCQAPIPE